MSLKRSDLDPEPESVFHLSRCKTLWQILRILIVSHHLGPGHCDGCEARLPDDPHPRTYRLQGFHLYFMSIREHFLAD
jgi:hypothetical protein